LPARPNKPKLASGPKPIYTGSRVFVQSSLAAESPQKNPFPYDALASGRGVYAYVRGNPISLRDPTGKDPVIGATVGAISGAFFGGLGAYVQGGSAEDIAIAAAYGLGSGAVIGAIDPSFGIATLAIVGGVAGGVGDLIGQTYAGAGTACKPIKWGSTIGAVAGGAIGGGGGLLYGRLAMAAGDSELVATSMGSVLSSVPGVIYPSIGDDMFPTKSTGCGCSQ
jgi:hypothetical protein